MENIKCIVTIVERGKADKIVEAAKNAGATGATIFYGRGTGESEAMKFFNLNIQSSKELILILSEQSKIKPIYTKMIEVGKLKDPGTGIIFTVDIDNLVGLHHREEIDNMLLD